MTILTEADALVNGERTADYDHPRRNFARTALIWEAVLGIPVTPRQVALCMIGVKLARDAFKPKADNLVDIAGYAQTAEMCMEATA